MIGAILCLLLWHNWFSSWSQDATDSFCATGTSATTGRIVIVAIDDHSLEKLGRWQDWPRRYHAQLIDRLHQSGARVIGLDMLFSEPSPDDPILADAISKAGNIVSPLVGTNNAPRVLESGEFVSFQHLLKPQPVLVKASSALGHVNASTGQDGVARRFPTIVSKDEDGEIVPALALAVVSKYLRLPTVNYLPQDGHVTLADRHIPVDDFGRTLINYAGPPSNAGVQSTFKVLSYVDVINDRFDPADVQGKIVLVGVMVSGATDRYLTPASDKNMSGVEIWANAMEMILSKRFLQEQPLIWQMAILMSMSIASGMVFFVLRPLKGSIVLFPFLAAYWLIVATASDHGMILNLLYPSLAVILVYVAAIACHYLCESRRRRQTMRLLGQYVSPDIAAVILKSVEAGELNLKGTSREATVLFADIRNFVGLAERLPPAETMSLLNTYMETAASIVDSHQGTTISFTGDGLLAVWNMPFARPDHALRAVRSAIEMQKAFREMGEGDDDSESVKLGIGINTGNMIAGNIGSKARLEYTVTGDAVNLACRLCELAEADGILIGRRTRELVLEHFEIESRGRKLLRHKERPEEVYSVVAQPCGA